MEYGETMNNPLKICLVASAGGHLSQLMILKEVWGGHKLVCVSTGEMVREKLEKLGKTYIVGECNRESPVKTFLVMINCLKIILQIRPRVVISTGAAVGFLMCFWGKLFGAKVVWIDSIANTEKLSMSGRMILPVADMVLSQWPEVAAKYLNVEYAGELI
jgi:UDP-N-acetylglucosamine:LPS N-acetylglucosamine transferase